MTVKTFIMLQMITVSNKCCSFLAFYSSVNHEKNKLCVLTSKKEYLIHLNLEGFNRLGFQAGVLYFLKELSISNMQIPH